MQKSIIDIAIDFSSSNRIFFSTMILASVYAISILILLLSSLFLSSSIFVFGADPGMTPSPQSPSPPAGAIRGEKPGMVPVPPPPPTASTAIDKLLGPKTLPKVEEKVDPKDGDTILSSKTDDGGTTTVATKVSKDSDTRTFDFNRGYVMGFAAALNPGLSEGFNKKSKLLTAYLPALNEDYRNGILSGYRDGLRYLDTFGLLDKNGSEPKK